MLDDGEKAMLARLEEEAITEADRRVLGDYAEEECASLDEDVVAERRRVVELYAAAALKAAGGDAAGAERAVAALGSVRQGGEGECEERARDWDGPEKMGDYYFQSHTLGI